MKYMLLTGLLLGSLTVQAQVSGTVKDQAGEPIIGANVFVTYKTYDQMIGFVGFRYGKSTVLTSGYPTGNVFPENVGAYNRFACTGFHRLRIDSVDCWSRVTCVTLCSLR